MLLVPATDPVLWTKAEPVSNIDALWPVIAEMQALLKKKKGAGLAAPQVGIPLRFFITQMGLVVINPVMYEHSQELSDESEGCLSFPGLRRPVRRYRTCSFAWVDEKKDAHMRFLTGALARLFQHETEHLDGKCIFARPK